MITVPKEGSRKRQVYDVLQTDGPQAATSLATSLGLASGTVRSWLGSWGKGGVTKPKPKPNTEPEPFTVHYRFDSEALARREANTKAKSIGADPEIFGVVTNGKKWGIQPRHLASDVIPGVFKKGQRVYDMTNNAKIGLIVAVGAEVSEVQWIGGMRQYVTNTYLRHAAAEPHKKKR